LLHPRVRLLRLRLALLPALRRADLHLLRLVSLRHRRVVRLLRLPTS
jgi:hypothetical protein